jgi:membrane-bound lytic murein transglycosylase B
MVLMWGTLAAASLLGSSLVQSDPLAPLPGKAVNQAPTPRPQVARPTTLPNRAPIAPLTVICTEACTGPATSVQPAITGFAAYKLRLAQRARAEGIREATIAAAMASLALDGRVVALDRQQPGGINRPNAYPPFAPYRRQHVSADLIRRGQSRFQANAVALAAVERRFGVEASVLLSIYGHETSYGTVTGGFDLLSALATLAYEGRRRALFETEFVAALRLLDRGTPRSRLKGSWAGATGYPQFMPTAVLRLAVDGDGDGASNIWANEIDGLASIANYLREAGWKPNVHWGVPARVPAGFDRRSVASRLVAPRCPQVYKRHSQWRSLSEWRALGVVPTGSTLGINEGEQLSLVEPDGADATAYLLSINYRAILDYNCSNFYALAVGLLADRIAQR